MIAQAIGDALFLRKVGSLDDNLKTTGKLPTVYRASQWPCRLDDVEEVERFFTDGRLPILISLAGLECSAYSFIRAAKTLPPDHHIRNDPGSVKERTLKQEKLITEEEKRKLPKATNRFNKYK